MPRTKLTEGQLEVLLMRADGMSVREIADELGLHTETVKKRLHEARNRLGARGTANAMLLAGRLGLLEVAP